jgi:hypothetical protein
MLGHPALSPAQLAAGVGAGSSPRGCRTAKRRRGPKPNRLEVRVGLGACRHRRRRLGPQRVPARLAADDQAELVQRMLARLRERGCWSGAGGSAPRPARWWPRCGARTGWSWSLRRCGPRWKRWRRSAELADYAGASAWDGQQLTIAQPAGVAVAGALLVDVTDRTDGGVQIHGPRPATGPAPVQTLASSSRQVRSSWRTGRR